MTRSHLTVRVAWHDSRWDARICLHPRTLLHRFDRIREERDDASEDRLAGKRWSNLAVEDLPPCVAESAGFMNTQPWVRTVRHPYQTIKRAAATHGRLLPTRIEVPKFSTFAVPFNWMLRGNQERIEADLPEPLPPDEEPPFDSAWVFGRQRQEALARLFFSRLEEKRSLVFFYTKEGQPLGDWIPRLVVGVGRLERVGPLIHNDASGGEAYPKTPAIAGSCVASHRRSSSRRRR